MKSSIAGILIPGVFVVVAVASLVLWASIGPLDRVGKRIVGLDKVVEDTTAVVLEAPVPGEPIRSGVEPADLPGTWPWFRGPNLDVICDDGVPLSREWPVNGPPTLWSIDLGNGYAAAAVHDGCVYVLDYDNEALADTMRCFSLADGEEIWRNSYPVRIVENHGMSRTIPAVVDQFVISLGPKCHVVCWDAATGEARWLLDLVLDYGATVPKWYAGQCPLIDNGRLIVAPGGDALLMAVDYASDSPEVIWKSKNPNAWVMTHSSIVPIEFAGRRIYVYCGRGGVAGVAADDGEILWETTDWKVDMATSPSPVIVPGGRIFCSGGYRSGAVMLQLKEDGEKIVVETAFRLKYRQFGSEQQTPILYDGHLYGIRQQGEQFVCLDLEGNEVWNSGKDKFGAAPYMVADGLLFILNDDGLLTLAEATHRGYRPLAKAQVILDAHHSWGPMAMVAGRLIVRDMKRMVCLDVAKK